MGQTPRCSHCAGTDVYLIPPERDQPEDGKGSMSERRVWRCRDCRKQFSVLTGTIMHATKIPVRTWVLVIFDMCSAKNGISAREVERKYGLTIKTAWHMLHRIRQAMGTESCSGPCEESSWPTKPGSAVSPRTATLGSAMGPRGA